MDQHFFLFSVCLLWMLITNVPVNSEKSSTDIVLNDAKSVTDTFSTTPVYTTTVATTTVEATPFSTLPGFNIDFEDGTIAAWTEASRRSVKWKVENKNSPWELDNAAPAPANGSSYLRVDRGSSLSFGVAIFRSPVVISPPDVRLITLSFSFWIRSKWPQFTNLEIYTVVDGKEELFKALYQYADINNRKWQTTSIPRNITTTGRNFELQVVFYAYCGTNVEDAVAIDDISLTITGGSTLTTETTTTPFLTTQPPTQTPRQTPTQPPAESTTMEPPTMEPPTTEPPTTEPPTTEPPTTEPPTTEPPTTEPPTTEPPTMETPTMEPPTTESTTPATTIASPFLRLIGQILQLINL
ncbi:mucin-2-like isoform X1 [Daphnia carinata]|uniref:mucin-2-like isoform X1 n=1 Tax=Daphnia carinata TaxID=120202 RepID=UPI00286842F3|nr:mucin-2-like isoform X1 [Daphnia carinata]XP_059351003.1 mucin-2-like isoform X1 [Daphnia carinata]XP_059351004.1 mucin-2-like isoform X1 [Daphnia carinata]XP_059351005.1 mucin-2-like isoform X1 [Daphnia carinata]